MRRLFALAAFIAVVSIPTVSCRTGQSTWDNIVTDVTTIVDCSKAACAEAGPVCAQMQVDVLACLPAILSGNPGPCASLLSFANGKIAYADLICIVDAFTTDAPDQPLARRYLASSNTSAPSLADTQAAARKWIADQHVGVIRAKAAK
jgi:hypothetical protein